MTAFISRRSMLGFGASALAASALPAFAQGSDRPVRLVLPITHYEIDAGKWLDESSRLACEWFTRFLM